jgi:epoxyqueuosine reductase
METESLFLPDLTKIVKLSPEQFRENFRGSPIRRTKWQGLVRSACIALGNAQIARGSASYREAIDALTGLSQSDDAVISESARWALLRIQANGG